MICMIAIFSLFSCQSTRVIQEDIPKAYIDTNGQKVLTLNPDGTFNLAYTDDYFKSLKVWKLQQLSFGTWRQEDGFILLSSSENIQSPVLDIIVEEKTIEYDSLKIEITNPYEKYDGLIDAYGNPVSNTFSRIFSYVFYADSRDPLFEQDLVLNTPAKTFPVSEDFSINGFWLFMVPDPYLYPGNLAFNFLESRYTVKNPSSNHFKIDIPDFTLEYIGYIRYKEEYVKIVDDKTIQIRGEVFKRK